MAMYKYALAILACGAFPAFAGEVDFSARILDMNGDPMPISSSKDAAPALLSDVATSALLTEAPAPEQRGPTGRGQDGVSEKLARFNLALKVHNAGKVMLTSEEITLVKTAIAQVYGPLVVGRAVQMLDPSVATK